MPNQYVFGTLKGTDGERRIVRVKAQEEIILEENVFLTAETKSDDMTASYLFKVGECIKTDTDMEGNHYAWYYVTDYAATIDRTPGCNIDIAANSEKINSVEDAVCELDESAGARLDSIEDALCELDELLNK